MHFKFVNDLEKDRVYRSWAKSLREVCLHVGERGGGGEGVHRLTQHGD